MSCSSSSLPTVWTRKQVADRILAGDTLFIYRNQLIRVPQAWLDAHPGGALPILHFVGRDASDELEAFHSTSVLNLVVKYAIGTVDVAQHGWEPLLPPVMSGWVRKRVQDGSSTDWYREADIEQRTDHFSNSQILLVDKDSSLIQPPAPSLASITPRPNSLSLEVQARHSAAYKTLHQRITDAGLYSTPYLTGYGPEILRYVLLAAISAVAYSKNWLITSAIFLGLTWHQLVFCAHDLGHMGVTHNWTIDRIIGTIIGNFIGGLSIGWWVDNHNVHHLVTNHPSHDPDIEHLPFFAVSTAFFLPLWSSYYKRIMPFDRFTVLLISLQHKLFFLIMAFARFNLYLRSYTFLFNKAFDNRRRARGGRWAWRLEIIGLVFFWCWFGAVLKGCGSWTMAIAYFLVSHAATSPLHVQIVLSHFSMSTSDLGPIESFPHRQMRTTTDVICPQSLAFLHGGLHLQVTHHLFPRLPRHNLYKASKMVKEFAKEQGLVYAEFGFVKGNHDVLGVLRDVAEQVKIVGMVAQAEAKEAVEKSNAAAAKRTL